MVMHINKISELLTSCLKEEISSVANFYIITHLSRKMRREYDLNILLLLSSGHAWRSPTHIHLQCNLNSVQPNHSQQRLRAVPVTSPAKWLKQTSSWCEITMPKNKHVNHYVLNTILPQHFTHTAGARCLRPLWKSGIETHFNLDIVGILKNVKETLSSKISMRYWFSRSLFK